MTEMPDLDIEQKPSRRLWILAAVRRSRCIVGGGRWRLHICETDDSDDSSARRRSRSAWN